MKSQDQDRGMLTVAGGWTGLLSLVVLWVGLDVLLLAASGPPDAFGFVLVNFILIPVLCVTLFITTSVLSIRNIADRNWRGVSQTVLRLLFFVGMALLIASGRIALIVQFFWGGPAGT